MESSQIAPSLQQASKEIGDSYLSFSLNQQTPALLPMEYAQEVIIVPTTRLTPMPNMQECIVGLLNRRSRVVWVVNLAQLLNLPTVDPIAQQYQIAIVQSEQVKLGLVVQSVKGVTHFPPQSSQAPTEVSSLLAPYVSGCIAQGNELQIVLDVNKILTSPKLQPASSWLE